MAEIEGTVLEKWLVLFDAQLRAIDARLASLEASLTANAMPAPSSHQHVYQVLYQDRPAHSARPMKTVLIPKSLPPLPCSSVPMLGRILGVLEGHVSVRQRQGESMADDLIAILKRDESN